MIRTLPRSRHARFRANGRVDDEPAARGWNTVQLVPKLAAAAVLLTVLSVAIFPYVETGPTDGFSPRTQAIVAAVLVAIGAAGAMLAARRRT